MRFLIFLVFSRYNQWIYRKVYIMKVLRFYVFEDVCFEDVFELECKFDEIKIKVCNCFICGIDVKIFYNGYQNIIGVMIMGYEVVGEIVEIGFEVVGDWKVGDWVQLIVVVLCGQCYECCKGWMQVC